MAGPGQSDLTLQEAFDRVFRLADAMSNGNAADTESINLIKALARGSHQWKEKG